MGYLLGVPIIWILVYWGLYWGPPILGHCQIYMLNMCIYTCCEYLHIIGVKGTIRVLHAETINPVDRG